MGEHAPSFVCKCGADLSAADAWVDGIDEMGVEIVVECPECEAEYFAYVQPQHFCNAEGG